MCEASRNAGEIRDGCSEKGKLLLFGTPAARQLTGNRMNKKVHYSHHPFI